MKAKLPTITIKKLDDGRFIATNEDDIANVLNNRVELNEYIDSWCMYEEMGNDILTSFELMMGDPIEELEDLIDSIKK